MHVLESWKKAMALYIPRGKNSNKKIQGVYYAIMQLYERVQRLIAMLGTFTFTLKNNEILLKKRYTTIMLDESGYGEWIEEAED